MVSGALFLQAVRLTGRAAHKKITFSYFLCISGSIILDLYAYNDLSKAQKDPLTPDEWMEISLKPEVLV